MTKPKKVLGLLVMAVACLVAMNWESIRFWTVARRATDEEVQALLGAPRHVLSPTGWHATPSTATGFVHRWREVTPVGQWDGHFKTSIAEGWVRARFDLEGALIGHSYFYADGRLEYQSKPAGGEGKVKKSPPWWWDEQDRVIVTNPK